MLTRLAVLKDKKRVWRTKRTLADAVAGKKVSGPRLKAAQGFLLDLLKEINSKRPQTPIRCGGNILEQKKRPLG